ncbi:MAG: alanine:cation symporter family protein [Deltaproteobacteria bacterium]|nr:alanine:cation symporter family protein [Deltaproteobacteria bacterium]
MFRRFLAFALTLFSPALALAQAGAAEATPTGLARLDAIFGHYVVAPIASVFFFDLAFWDNGDPGEIKIPIIVLWLVLGAIFFTLRFKFINLRGFWHAIQVTRGKYDDPSHEGEVSHFQALSSALSATVGLGNIAGVAVAVHTGGPGAVFWMVIAGFLGMSSKFTECTLGQLYREVDARGNLSGGPMRYLQKGLSELGMKGFGRVLAVAFAILCIGGSFGGGNMFQANQSYAQVKEVIPFFDSDMGALAYGVLLALMVGVVIIGGIKRIGTVAGVVVPIMCGVYLLAGAFIIISNADQIVPAFSHIVGQAFTPEAGFGGMIGVLMTGFQRAAFSNEAGIGSASIAHSAAATDEPVREGIVALLEPFIDTILVCTMTGLVMVITNTYENSGEGVVMTSNAFATVLPWFPKVLTFAVFMFAFSTMISWSYYGERCFTYLFGTGTSMLYRVIFLGFVVLGSVLELGSVLDFSDLMVLGMAFPNILGLYLLSGKVKRALDSYWSKLKSGEMKPSSR